MDEGAPQRAIGRGKLVDRVTEALSRHRVAVLHGVPGIGKTTIVWELLARARAAGRAVAYVEVRPKEPLSSVLARAAAELGVALEVPSIGLLLGAADARDALLAFDSAEDIEEAGVRDLVRYAQGSLRRGGRVLFATRRLPRLGPRDRLEVFVEEVPLLAPEEVAALLRAHGAEPGDAVDWPGHPLLLKLRLALGREPGSSRPSLRAIDQTVRGLVQETLEGLGPSERTSLALLAATRYPWRVEGLSSVIDPAMLESLERRGALTERGGRVHLHPLFAVADAGGGVGRALLRRAARVLEADAVGDPRAAIAAGELWALAREDRSALRVLRAALPTAAFHGLADSFGAILGRLRLSGRWRDIARVAAVSTRRFQPGHEADEAALRSLARSRDREVSRLARFELIRIGHVCARFEEVRRVAETLMTELPGSDGLGWSVRARLAFVEAELGRNEEAWVVLEDLTRRAKTPDQHAQVILGRTFLHLLQGRARAALADVRRLFRLEGLPPLLAAYGHGHAGIALGMLGRLGPALRANERAHERFSADAPLLAVGVVADRARFLSSLGRAAEARRAVESLVGIPGLPPLYRQDLLEARAEAELADGRPHAARSDAEASASAPRPSETSLHGMWLEAEVFRALARPADAARALAATLKEPAARVPFARARIAVATAMLHADEGRVEPGMRAVAEAASVLEPLRLRPWLARLSRERARLELLAGRTEDAEASAAAAVRHARYTGAPREHAAALQVAAEVAVARGKEEDAEALLARAFDLSEAASDPLGSAQSLLARAANALSRRRTEEAHALLRLARGRIHGRSAASLEAETERLTAAALLAQGDLDAARGAVRALEKSDPWRARLEIGIDVAAGRPAKAGLRAFGRSVRRLAAPAALRLIRRADSWGVPSAGRAVLFSEVGRLETTREEAAWRARSEGPRIVLDLDDRSCHVSGRPRPEVMRSDVLLRVLRALLEHGPRPLPPRELFEIVWGPPDRHDGFANVVWVTVARLRRIVGAGDALVAWVEEGYAIAPDCSFLLVLPQPG